ncbi:MAG: MATE family efflux transporter [Intestinibacter bartlettii]
MEKTNQNPMGTKPIASLIFTMGCPPIVSMFVQSMYNIVDSIFVAQLGENALTAVSLAAPLQYVLLAVSVGVGVGINSYISRNLGADNIDEANNTVTHSMILALAHSILFIILGLLFIKPFFRIYANNNEIFSAGVVILILSYCLFSLFFSNYIEKVFQAQENVVTYYLLK